MRRSPRPVFRGPARSLDDERADMTEELDFHLQRCADELEAEGWPAAEARREAARRFGDLEATRETCARESRRARHGEGRRMGIDALRRDLAYAVRTLRRAPTYAGVVIATLAVGIALNSLVFSVMSPYLVRPLPYDEPDRLVHLGGRDPAGTWDVGRFSIPQLADLRQRARGFVGLEGYFYGTSNLTGDGVAERLTSSWVTGGLFGLLGVEAALGRMPGPADGGAEATPVALIGHGLWTRRFGADPEVVGRAIRLDGVPHTVVGVAPPGLNFPFNAVQVWLPLAEDPVRADRAAMNTLVIGRLAEGWTAARAQADLERIQRELAARHPGEDGIYDTIVLHSLREVLNFAWDILRPAFLLMWAGVSLVLIIACVNVASLTLARAALRRREVAVRAALGAGRRRLVRQLLVESTVLAVAGGALGVTLAHLATPLVGSLIPGELYRVGDVRVDGGVLAFAAAVTLLTPLVFGLAPALAVARTDLSDSLKQGGAASGMGRGVLRGRRVLVLAQIALAVVLVAGTGLMVRSLANALSTDLGFPAERILTVAVTPATDAEADVGELNDGHRRLVEALAAVPGVAAVGAVSHLPLNHETIAIGFVATDDIDLPLERRPSAYTSRAAPGYFEAMGIPLSAGRDFRSGPADLEEGSVIVSRSVVERLWPGETGVGRLVVWGRDEPVTSTVVGVVDDVRYDDLAGAPRPHVYRPLEGSGTRRRFLVVRAGTGADPRSLIEPVRRTLAAVAPDLPAELRPMPEIVRESTGLWAIGSIFLAAFGLVALGLAALGIYGLVSFTVAQRRSEIGLRMALGADRGAIVRAVVGEGLRLTGIGLAIGVLLSLGAGVLLSSVLFGVGPLDPATLAAAVAVFGAVSVVASALPARRAVRLDPLRALRAE